MTSVTLDWASLLSTALQFAVPVILAVIAYLANRIGGPAASVLKTQLVEQLLSRAIDYAVNTLTAYKGKPLTVDLHNAVVATAVQYVVDHGAPWLVEWMGGAAGIQQKIVARFNPAAVVSAPAASPSQ